MSPCYESCLSPGIWLYFKVEPAFYVLVSYKILVTLRLLHSTSLCFNSYPDLFISFSMASHQKVILVSLSICSAYSTLLGIRIPNLCVVFQYLLFTFVITLLRFLRVYLTRHENASTSSIPLCISYSATSLKFLMPLCL